MLATSKYDITLAGQGFILIEESYRKKAQQSFNPRFSTGDPNYGDLSFWQFLVQEAWDGGAGQLIFSQKNKIAESVGWDFRLGQPRISYGQRTVTYSAGSLTALTNSAFNQIGRFMRLAGSGAVPRLLLVGRNSGTYGDGTINTPTVSASDDPTISQINSETAVLWDRDAAIGGGNIFIAVSANVGGTANIKIYDTGLTLKATVVNGGSSPIKCLFPVSGTKLFVVTEVGEFYLHTWTSGAHTIASSKTRAPLAGGVSDRIMAHGVAMDSQGTIYVLTQDSVGPDGTGGLRRSQSVLYLFSSTDYGASGDGLASSSIEVLDQFIGTGICSLNGSIYTLGGMRLSSGAQVPAIIKFPNTVVWVGRSTTDTTWDNFISSYFIANRDTIYFIAKSSLGNYDSIYRLSADGVVIEICAIKSVAAQSNTYEHMACAFSGSRFYWYDATANAIYSTNDVRGSLDSSGSYAYLETSEFGANTPLINKTLYSVTVELSAALPSGESYTVLVNDASLGTISSSDGATKEITSGSTEFTSRGFKIKIRAPRTTSWTGYLKRITIKYAPTQFKKRAWAFGIRCDRHLKLIDGTRETSTPADLFTSIENSWVTNTPLTFVDVDGASYSVLVTDFDQRRPLLNRDSNMLEAMAFVELLEV